ncbi:ABC transporter substrate-binding protein (plasmid) [Aquamicrobium terrae]
MIIPSLRRPTAVLTAALLGVSLVLSAAIGASAQETRTINADNGTIEAPANPQRIATLGRANGSFLALGGKPIAVTKLRQGDFDALLEDQQAAYEAATLLGTSASEADLEKLASLKPDLIFISVPNADFEQMKEKLEAIAPTILLGFHSDWKRRVEVVAEASNKVDVLNKQKADYDQQVAAIKTKYAETIKNDTFVEVGSGEFSKVAVFHLNGSTCTEVVRADVGLDIADLGEGGQSRSYEQIGALADYDVILYPVDHKGNVTEAFRPMTESSAWQALPAVKSGRTVGIYCPLDRSYPGNSRYMESLDRGLAALPKDE